MAVTQYIGSRYVPLLADPVDWSDQNTYEALSIVLYQGNSYTSRQAVPKGIPITDERFWACTGNYNAQIELYRRETSLCREETNAVSEKVDLLEASVYGYNQAANPIFYGADNTGTVSSSDAIEQCIAANKGETVWFSPGTYKIDRPIRTPHPVADKISIDFGSAIIVCASPMAYALDIGGIDTQESGESGVRRTYFSDATFLCEDSETVIGVYVRDGYKDAIIDSCNVVGFMNGIKLGSANNALDCLVTNALIRSDYSSNHDSIGVLVEGSNCEISNCRIYGFHISIDCFGNETFVNNVHTLPKGYTDKAQLAGSAFARVNGNKGLFIDNSYCDTQANFVIVNAITPTITMSNCEYYSYLASLEMSIILFDYSEFEEAQTFAPRVNITNCYFRIPPHPNAANGKRNQTVKIIGRDYSTRTQLGLVLRKFTCQGNTLHNARNLYSGDFLSVRRGSDELQCAPIRQQISQNVWFPIAVCTSVEADNLIFLDILMGTSRHVSFGITLPANGVVNVTQNNPTVYGADLGGFEIGYTTSVVSNIRMTVFYLRNTSGAMTMNQGITGHSLSGEVFSVTPDYNVFPVSGTEPDTSNYINVDVANVIHLIGGSS